MRRRGIACALAISAFGCGVPIRFAKIDAPETTPVTGVRFTLRRPGTYAVSLVYERECLFRLALEQRLDGPPITYEATSRGNPFAATNIAFTIDESDGALTALTAGAADQLGPLLENLAELAGKVGAQGIKPTSCGGSDPALAKYVERHIRLRDALRNLRSQIAAEYAKLGTTTKPAPLVREIATLEKAATSLEETLAADRFALRDGQFELYIGTKLIAGNKDPKAVPWVKIVLSERKP